MKIISLRRIKNRQNKIYPITISGKHDEEGEGGNYKIIYFQS